MRDDEGEEWKIRDLRRDLAPAFREFGKARIRYAVLREREVVEITSISGRAIDEVKQWAEMFESSERIVEQTMVNRYWISTVFLGLNHNWDDDGPPLWFETMVFEELSSGKTKSDRFCRRYTTWAEAEAGHAAMVEIIRYGNF